MKTKLVRKSESPDKEYLIINPPYTVFGHSALHPSFSLVMKVGGLKAMLKDLSDEDSFRIEIFHGGQKTEYSFLKQGDRARD